MIKFYCKECGKEMWQSANREGIKCLTIEQIEHILICSDCINKEIEMINQKGENSWDWIRQKQLELNIDSVNLLDKRDN